MSKNEQLYKIGKMIEELYRELDSEKRNLSWGDKILSCGYVKHRVDYAGTEVAKQKLYSSCVKKDFEDVCKGFVEYLMPRGSNWFRLTLPLDYGVGYEAQLRNKELSEVLEGLTGLCHAEFVDSNYYSEVEKIIRDYNGLGTCHMGVEESEDGEVQYRCFDPQEVVIDTAKNGDVICAIRRYTVSWKNVKRWYRDKAEKALNGSSQCILYEALFPREGYLYSDEDSGFFTLPEKAGGIAHFIWNSTSGEMYADDFFYEMPMLTGRRDMDNDRVKYGHGLVEDNLEDIIMLNDMMKIRQTGFQKNVEPAWVVPYSLAGKLRTAPRSINSLPNMAEMPKPLTGYTDYSAMLRDIQDMEDKIKRNMGVDIYKTIMSNTDSRKTAYEVGQLKNEAMILMAQSIGNLHKEIITPCIKRTIKLKLRKAVVPVGLSEDFLMKFVDSARVELSSLFVQRLNAYLEMEGLVNTLNYFPVVAQLSPESMDVVNMDEFAKALLYGGGLPMKLVRGEREVKDIRQMRAEAQRAMAEGQLALDNSKAQLNLSKAEKEGGIAQEGGI